MNWFTLSNDPLGIPLTALAIYAGAAKSIAYIIFGGLFTFAIITKQIKLIAGEDVKLKETLWKACLVIIGLVLYDHIFLKIVAINEVISMSLFSCEDFYAFKASLSLVSEKITVSLLNMNIGLLISSIFLFTSTIAEDILLCLRYIMLAILYILGPLAFVAGILPATSSLTKGWFKTLLQVSFWIVILRVLQAVLLSMGVEKGIADTGAIELGLLGIIVTIMTFLVPLITEKLMSGANIGMMAGVAMGVVAGFGSKVMGKVSGTETGQKITKSIIGAGPSVAKGVYNKVFHGKPLLDVPEENKNKKSAPKR